MAFFLHDKQDSDIIAASLCQIKRWYGNRWLLQYMLTDDSAGVQAAVKKAFPGLEVGEMEVTHLLCTVHSERTLQRHFGSEAGQSSNILQLRSISERQRQAVMILSMPRSRPALN